MSDLLQKAIIDAKTLKEAAAKNAEQLIVEKYAQKIKEAVENMLEKDEDLGSDASLEDPTADLGGEGDSGGLGGGLEGDLGGDAAGASGGMENPMDMDLGGSMLGATPSEETVVDEQIPMAAGVGAPGEDEEIEIDFSELEKRLNSDKAPGEEAAVGMEDFSTEMTPPIEASTEQPAEVNPVTGQPEEELPNIDEDLLSGILETLEVDYEPVPDGWLGADKVQRAEATDGSLAKVAADEKEEVDTDLTKELVDKAQENEKLHQKLDEALKTITSLQKDIEKSKQNQEKLIKENKNLDDNAKSILFKLNESNIINARLLYMNRVLRSPSLNARQKKIYTEQLSKADSVEKAQVIYETLLSSVGSVANNLVKSADSKSLNEALSRKPSMTYLNTPRKEGKEISDSFANRMKQLAGIKK